MSLEKLTQGRLAGLRSQRVLGDFQLDRVDQRAAHIRIGRSHVQLLAALHE
jgi:hypothetical protein